MTIMPRHFRLMVYAVGSIATIACGSGREPRAAAHRWALNEYRLGLLPDSVRRQLSCTDQGSDGWEPWVRECYGGPNVRLGFDSAGMLSYMNEDMYWGDIQDANELWYRSRQHFTDALGAPDSVTAVEDFFETVTKGLSDSVRRAVGLQYSWMGTRLYAFWSRRDGG